MNRTQALLVRHAAVLVLAAAVLVLTSGSGRAQGVQHLSITQPGGMPGLPVMTGIQQTTNGIMLTWDGPSGYYQVLHKIHLTDPKWIALGGQTNLNRTATITTLNSNDFFRVSGPGPQYAGVQACAGCHQGIYRLSRRTRRTLKPLRLSSKFIRTPIRACLPCHTVGYGFTTGFTNALQTPQLEGVQCENCHGPAANHAANPEFPSTVPRVELAAQVCGGCHSAQLAPAEVVAHHPVAFSFEDWSDIAARRRGAGRASIHGSFHEQHQQLRPVPFRFRPRGPPGRRKSQLTLTNDFDVAITCAVCHDPHQTYVWTNELNGVITFTNQLTGNVAYITNNELGAVYTNQLRNPYASTNDFVLTTSEVFSNAYNPNINVCAQCHNDRGSAWTDTSRSPHESPQYNMLLGTVGQLATGPSPGYPAAHSQLEMQCAECHLQTATNNASGHTFEVATYNLCYNCHPDPAGLVQFVTSDISNQIQQTKASSGPVGHQRCAGGVADERSCATLAWEYTTPGDLSATTNSGPSAAQQSPDHHDIKKARFDLYLVLYDGSYGVHNGPYDIELLQAAQNFVDGQLYQ